MYKIFWRKIFLTVFALIFLGAVAVVFMIMNRDTFSLAVIVLDKISRKPIAGATVTMEEGRSCPPDLRECPPGLSKTQITNESGKADFSKMGDKFRELAHNNTSIIVTAMANGYFESEIILQMNLPNEIIIEMIGGDAVIVKSETDALARVKNNLEAAAWLKGRAHVQHEVYTLPIAPFVWTVNLSDEEAQKCTSVNPCAMYFEVDMRTGAVTNLTQK